jgi:hypothetical protein
MTVTHELGNALQGMLEEVVNGDNWGSVGYEDVSAVICARKALIDGTEADLVISINKMLKYFVNGLNLEDMAVVKEARRVISEVTGEEV